MLIKNIISITLIGQFYSSFLWTLYFYNLTEMIVPVIAIALVFLLLIDTFICSCIKHQVGPKYCYGWRCGV